MSNLDSIFGREIPILFLKNPSEPSDPYESFFSTPRSIHSDEHGEGTGNSHSKEKLKFKPRFLPVQEFRYNSVSLERLGDLLRRGAFQAIEGHEKSNVTRYGGLVFTSPRAVSAFLSILPELDENCTTWLPESWPIYSVGPATTSLLRSHSITARCDIEGEDTGNGEALASFIEEKYPSRSWGNAKLPLLFLSGEQRRDMLPRRLKAAGIELHEEVVYEAVLRENFAKSLCSVLDKLCGTRTIPSLPGSHVWAVVFSPTGSKELLEYTGALTQVSDAKRPRGTNLSSSIRIATIGPTTRDHLINTFGIKPDVCAPKPSPEGVMDGIRHFYDIVD